MLQNDGYSGYEQIGGPGLKRAACWAHARRYFVQAHEVAAEGDLTALRIVEATGELYAVEKEARESRCDAEARLVCFCAYIR